MGEGLCRDYTYSGLSGGPNATYFYKTEVEETEKGGSNMTRETYWMDRASISFPVFDHFCLTHLSFSLAFNVSFIILYFSQWYIWNKFALILTDLVKSLNLKTFHWCQQCVRIGGLWLLRSQEHTDIRVHTEQSPQREIQKLVEWLLHIKELQKYRLHNRYEKLRHTS